MGTNSPDNICCGIVKGCLRRDRVCCRESVFEYDSEFADRSSCSTDFIVAWTKMLPHSKQHRITERNVKWGRGSHSQCSKQCTNEQTKG